MGAVATPTVCKPTTARAGVEAVNTPTFPPDHSEGADHRVNGIDEAWKVSCGDLEGWLPG
jgi:hypothetical protein